MAGFFGFFDFTKPGPGVPRPEDAPPKARIVVFFEIYFRKFWKLVGLNLLFNIFNIPAVIGAIYASGYVFRHEFSDDPMMDLLTRFSLMSVLLCIPFITLGPAQAGMTYILRNYAREEHAFPWWDFKEHSLKNLKQGFAVCIIDFIIVLLFGIAVNFYLNFDKDSLLMAALSTFIIISFVIFIMMHLYIYPMMVTFKYTVSQLYRNAMLLAIAKFLPNLGILILCSALVILSFFFNPIIGILLYALITISTIGLIINFYVYPKLKKYIIDRIEEPSQ